MISREALVGKWKSYKTLLPDKEKLCDAANFQEFMFGADGSIFMDFVRDNFSSQSATDKTWDVQSERQADGSLKHFLILNNKLRYEILSVNSDFLVLKTLLAIICFAKEHKWLELVSPPVPY